MRALDRKLVRDLRRMLGQVIAIGLVMGCGVATFTMSLSTTDSLQATLSTYYDRARFADVFARLERAPNALADRIAAIPGVAELETRVVAEVTLDVPGLAEPASGRLLSLPTLREPRLDRLHLRRGRWIEPGRPGEVLVSEAFAEAHRMAPGDTVTAVINGRRERLVIVGIVLSPEYVFQIRPGEFLPDDRRFGVFWMSEEELAPAWDMDGAFNDVAIRLGHGASQAEVVTRLDDLLAAYGGQGAHGRDDQTSHKFLVNELRQLRGMTVIVPAIFLSVAAFLLHIVMSRLIRTEREEIATLKAFGYSRREVGGHYLKFAGGIALVGLVLGTIAGAWLGGELTQLYQRFFRFPIFRYRMEPAVIATAGVVAGGAALLGAMSAVRRAMRLPPAEAMRPEPPASFRPTVVERLGVARFFSHAARMILREIERQPARALLSGLGLALAVAILVLGTFMLDAIDRVIDIEFFRGQRHDATLTFVEPTSAAALSDVLHLPGVLAAEPFRSVPARLRFGHRERRVGILGLPADGRLHRIIDERRGVVSLPPEGLAMSEVLADALGVRVGDVVTVEVLENERPPRSASSFSAGTPRPTVTTKGTRALPVTDLIADFAGTAAYMRLDALHRMMREGGSLSGAFVRVDATQLPDLYAQVKETPRIAGMSAKRATLESFRATIAENLLIMRTINVMFAAIISFGVVYNAARISAAERSLEFGTLRVMGFTHAEISAILLGELAVLVLAAIPVGLVLGHFFAALATAAMATETQRFPFFVSRFTYGFATTVVLVSALVSGSSVRRQLRRLDLVAVLKAKD